MRTSERLRKLQDWTYRTICKGRMMKAPGPNMDIRVFTRQEPKVFLVYTPTRPDETDYGVDIDPLYVSPGIIIMPTAGYLKNMEEQRFDRYNNVHRSKEMGQTLSVQVLFFVFENGVRLPGFKESTETGSYDMTKIMEGTEEGLFTLMDWMDDFKDALLSQKTIPNTDMFLNEASSQYGLFSDQRFVADRRPAFIGIVTATFQCHADEENEEIRKMLR